MRRWRLRLVAVFATLLCAALLALASCSKESPPPGLSPPPVNPVVVDALIGPEGGTLTHPAGAKIVVPPGALTAPTRITLGGIAAPGADVLGSEPLAQAFQAGPEGQVFLKPVDVFVPFDPTRLAPGADAKNVQVRMAAHGSTSFAALQSSVDLGARTVRASTVHFTDFVPAADAKAIFITSDPTLPQATVGVAYAQQLTATGGTGPYTWTATGLPSGLALAPAGAISGTPTAPGASSFFVTASDSASHAVALAFTLSVVPAAANPVPVLNQISPASAVQGSPDKPITLLGAGFVPASQALFDGTALATTFRDAATLSATIPASAFVNFGNHTVSVTSPAPGGGTSASLAFTVTPSALNPVPTIVSVSPAALPIAQTDASISITGTNFISTSSAVIGSQAIPTSYVSGTQLNATIPASFLGVAGTLQIGVRNPAPGGGTSATTVPVVVATPNPVPTLTSLSPSSVAAGSSDFTVSATGTGFVAGGKLFFGTTALATTVASATSASATVPASLVSAAGSVMVTFVNPTPGGGTSGSVAFQITVSDAGADVDSGPLPDAGTGCSRFFGDIADQSFGSIALDGQGGVVVSGLFEWTTDFGGGPLYSPAAEAALVAKFDPSCDHLWSVKVAEGSGMVATDPIGNVFVAVTEDTMSVTPSSPGPFDLMLVKLDPSGGTVFSKRFAGEGQWLGLGSDRRGGVVALGVTGTNESTTFDPDAGPISSQYGQPAYFVVAFDANGNLRWQRPSGGAGAASVLADSAGNLITYGGVNVEKLDPSGAMLWSSRYTAQCSAALTAADDVVVACPLQGGPVDFGTGPLTSAGESDTVLLKLSGADGRALWAKRYGGPYDERPDEIAVDGSGNLIVTGSGGSSLSGGASVTVDVGAGPMSTAAASTPGDLSFDILFARYDESGNPLSSALYGDGEVQLGGAKIAAAPSGDIFLAGGTHGDLDFGSGRLLNAFPRSNQAFLVRSPGSAAPIPPPPPSTCDAGSCRQLIIPAGATGTVGPGSMTTNSTTIFFAASGGIQSCPKSGCTTPTSVVVSPGAGYGMAANDQYLFWANTSNTPFQPSTQNRCSLSDCPGTAAVIYSEGFFNTSQGIPIPAAPPVIDATGNPYFPAGRYKDTLVGCSSCLNPPGDYIYSVAATPAGVFWLNQTGVQGPGFSYPGSSGGGGSVAGDGTRVFWPLGYAPPQSGSKSVVVGCPVAGCGPSPVVYGYGSSYSPYVATDGTSVYWQQQQGPNGPYDVYRCPVTGCPPRIPDVMMTDVAAVLLDGPYLYSMTGGQSQVGIYRTPK